MQCNVSGIAEINEVADHKLQHSLEGSWRAMANTFQGLASERSCGKSRRDAEIALRSKLKEPQRLYIITIRLASADLLPLIISREFDWLGELFFRYSSLDDTTIWLNDTKVPLHILE